MAVDLKDTCFMCSDKPIGQGFVAPSSAMSAQYSSSPAATPVAKSTDTKTPPR